MTGLELRELRKTHRSRGQPSVDAVRGIDLSLCSGELPGLPGPSGCGKSTTSRMTAGLESVTGGDILPGIATGDGHTRLSGSVRIAPPVPGERGRAVVAGVRPEDVRLTADGDLPARVVDHEPPLETGLATLALDGVGHHLVVLTGPGVRLAHDDRVRVAADRSHTHVFDAETGEAPR
ncbi:ATP-binding cassette domain-containing protein [Streptomyces sp. NPDC019990]|uniref:ATP-binding cassette domain-containing protein n=1 Tax=Streptomyces sp. NPDC019990 TaxID=3154693 RepID=UPI0033D12EF2